MHSEAGRTNYSEQIGDEPMVKNHPVRAAQTSPDQNLVKIRTGNYSAVFVSSLFCSVNYDPSF